MLLPIQKFKLEHKTHSANHQTAVGRGIAFKFIALFLLVHAGGSGFKQSFVGVIIIISTVRQE